MLLYRVCVMSLDAVIQDPCVTVHVSHSRTKIITYLSGFSILRISSASIFLPVFPLPDSSADDSFYPCKLLPPFCVLFRFVPYPMDQRLDRRLIPFQFALLIILKYTYCDHLRSVWGDEIRKDPLPGKSLVFLRRIEQVTDRPGK